MMTDQDAFCLCCCDGFRNSPCWVRSQGVCELQQGHYSRNSSCLWVSYLQQAAAVVAGGITVSASSADCSAKSSKNTREQHLWYYVVRYCCTRYNGIPGSWVPGTCGAKEAAITTLGTPFYSSSSSSMDKRVARYQPGTSTPGALKPPRTIYLDRSCPGKVLLFAVPVWYACITGSWL